MTEHRISQVTQKLGGFTYSQVDYAVNVVQTLWKNRHQQPRLAQCHDLSIGEAVAIRFHDLLLCTQNKSMITLQLPWGTLQSNVNPVPDKN